MLVKTTRLIPLSKTLWSLPKPLLHTMGRCILRLFIKVKDPSLLTSLKTGDGTCPILPDHKPSSKWNWLLRGQQCQNRQIFHCQQALPQLVSACGKSRTEQAPRNGFIYTNIYHSIPRTGNLYFKQAKFWDSGARLCKALEISRTRCKTRMPCINCTHLPEGRRGRRLCAVLRRFPTKSLNHVSPAKSSEYDKVVGLKSAARGSISTVWNDLLGPAVARIKALLPWMEQDVKAIRNMLLGKL